MQVRKISVFFGMVWVLISLNLLGCGSNLRWYSYHDINEGPEDLIFKVNNIYGKENASPSNVKIKIELFGKENQEIEIKELVVGDENRELIWETEVINCKNPIDSIFVKRKFTYKERVVWSREISAPRDKKYLSFKKISCGQKIGTKEVIPKYIIHIVSPGMVPDTLNINIKFVENNVKIKEQREFSKTFKRKLEHEKTWYPWHGV